MVVRHEPADDMVLCISHNRLAERQGCSPVKHFEALVDGGYFLVREQPVALDDAGLLHIVKDIPPSGVQLFVQYRAIAAGAAKAICALNRIVRSVPFFACPVIAAVLLTDPSLVPRLEL